MTSSSVVTFEDKCGRPCEAGVSVGQPGRERGMDFGRTSATPQSTSTIIRIMCRGLKACFSAGLLPHHLPRSHRGPSTGAYQRRRPRCRCCLSTPSEGWILSVYPRYGSFLFTVHVACHTDAYCTRGDSYSNYLASTDGSGLSRQYRPQRLSRRYRPQRLPTHHARLFHRQWNSRFAYDARYRSGHDPALCRGLAAAQNLKYYGVQYGNQCYGGSNFRLEQIRAVECLYHALCWRQHANLRRILGTECLAANTVKPSPLLSEASSVPAEVGGRRRRLVVRVQACEGPVVGQGARRPHPVPVRL